MPFATAYVSREGKQITIKKIEDTIGFWNLDKSRVPIGSVEINLLEPNLSLVSIDLKLGYTANVMIRLD